MAAHQHAQDSDTERQNALHRAGQSLEHAEQGLSDQIAAIQDQHPSVSLEGIRTAMADLNEAVRMHKDGMEALGGSGEGEGGAHASGGHVSGGQAVRHDDDATAAETQKSLDQSKASAEGKQSTASKDAKDDDHKRS